MALHQNNVFLQKVVHFSGWTRQDVKNRKRQGYNKPILLFCPKDVLKMIKYRAANQNFFAGLELDPAHRDTRLDATALD